MVAHPLNHRLALYLSCRVLLGCKVEAFRPRARKARVVVSVASRQGRCLLARQRLGVDPLKVAPKVLLAPLEPWVQSAQTVWEKQSSQPPQMLVVVSRGRVPMSASLLLAPVILTVAVARVLEYRPRSAVV